MVLRPAGAEDEVETRSLKLTPVLAEGVGQRPVVLRPAVAGDSVKTRPKMLRTVVIGEQGRDQWCWDLQGQRMERRRDQ